MPNHTDPLMMPPETPDYRFARPRDYVDWSPENTFVVSGPLPGYEDRNWPGRVFTRPEARAWVNETYDVIHEVHPKPVGKWAFRVRRGRYTPPDESTLPERARKVVK